MLTVESRGILPMSGVGLLACNSSLILALMAQEAAELRPDQMANLSIVRMQAVPRYPRPGENVRITLTVRNNATHRQDAVPVTLSGAGRAVTLPVALDAGQTRQLTLPWRAPAPGVYMLSTRIDPDLTLAEVDRADNIASVEVAVAPRAPANSDLMVSDVVVTPEPATGQAVGRVTVKNTGAQRAQAPLELKVGDGPVEVRLVELAPGEARVIEFPVLDKAGRVAAVVAPRDRASDRSPDNNLLVREPPVPVDLAVERLSISTPQFAEGQPRQVTISFEVRNLGQSPVTAPFDISIAPGKVLPGPPAALAEDRVPVPALAGGASIYVSRTVISPVGEFDVRVEADPGRAAPDADRSNNVAQWHFKNPAAEVGRWVSIGPALITGGLGSVGRLSAIAIHRSAPATIYVGAFQSGIWKTTDGGISWAPVGDSLPSLSIGGIAIAPNNPFRIYVATADAGMFRSDDGGGTWQMLANSPNGEVRFGVLLISPRNPDLMYLATSDGVHRSSDAGATWTNVLPNGQATDLVFAQGAPTTLYAAVAGDGVYKTVDGGTTWARSSSGLPALPPGFQTTLAASRSAPNTLYAASGASAGLQLFRSDDGGSTWVRKNLPADPTLYNDAIAVGTDNPDIVYVSGINLWRSDDGGQTFTRLTGPHVDYHAFLNDPIAPATIYALNDGGIYKSFNNGVSWSFIGSGLRNVEFYDHGVAPSDPVLTFGGTQDNGTLKYSGMSTWTQIFGGDGATVAIDPTDPNIIYLMNQGADSLARMENGVAAPFDAGLPTGAVCNNLQFHLHPRNRETLLAPCQALWRTTTTVPPGDWRSILAQPMSGNIVRSAIDPVTDIYYAGSTRGQLFAGPGGAGWREVFQHPSFAGVTDIDVDPADPRAILVSFNASGADRVYRFARTSTSPVTLAGQPIGLGLPSGIKVQALAIDLSRSFTAYAATNKGVYRGLSPSGAGPWTWTSYNVGLPLADVRDLEFHPTTGVLRAATYGRSAYEVNTVDPIGSVLTAQGRIMLLRAHDVGTGYGPPTDFLDAEAVVHLDSLPGNSFGFQLRQDANKSAHRGMFALLRKAFAQNRPVRIDYVRTGLRSGRIIRAMLVP